MANLHEKSTRYIIDFVKQLVPDATVKQFSDFSDFTFRIDLLDGRVIVRFDRSEMDDFEVALEKFQNTDYFYTLENGIRFHILISLGVKGLIPDLEISSELLREKGEWLKNIRVDVTFDRDFSAVLYQGLKLLSASIEKTLSFGPKLPEVEAEKRTIENLKRFYEKTGHLNSEGAEIESLSYLKAAAVCVIMEKEKARREVKIPRLKKALDNEIYSIVSKIRGDPFRDIKLPEAIHDYAIQYDAAKAPKKPKYVREFVTDAEQNKLDKLLDQLDPRLRRRRQGAWEVLRSDSPDRLSQAANSMVELLNQVISQVCKNTDLTTFLKTKYQTHQKTDWIEATRKWISHTKNNLHSAKHHVDHQSEQLTKALLTTAERIILVILE